VAALAPAIVAVLPGKVPQVVVLISGGILIGPQVLGIGHPGSISLLSDIRLGFLFLMAGYELEAGQLRQRSGRMAIAGWLASAALSVGFVAVLTATGFVRDFVPIGLALTTTALGTLLPILQEEDLLSGDFGKYVLAAGAVGELFPIVAISIFLTGRKEYVAFASLVVVLAVAVVLTAAPRVLGENRLQALVRQGRRATAQTTLRWAIVLLVVLLTLAAHFGLDVVLGAVLAGLVLRRWINRMGDVEPLENKLEAVGYGVFIPLFFVSSGMSLDVRSIIDNPFRLIVFVVLLLVVRGLPSLLIYARVLRLRERFEMTFITATTMPLLIALAAIGLSDGVMLPANAAALVGAGVVSVLAFPAIATLLRRTSRSSSDPGSDEPRQGAEGL
jgi:Kef-type K+ transport system membrane component KefB